MSPRVSLDCLEPSGLIPLMELKELGETLGAVGVVGGSVLWLFREKLALWAKGQTRERLRGMEDRIGQLERKQANHEGELMRVAESLERTSENIGDAVKRLTVAMERIVDGHEEMRNRQAETAEVVARVDERTRAIMELRQGARP